MYVYLNERCRLFTDEGQRRFLKIRDRVKDILKESGAISMEAAIRNIDGDTWLSMACVDRMVELKELKEVLSDKIYAERIFT